MVRLKDAELKALEAIRRSDPDKKLRAADVIDAARKKSNPLHGRFEWDDSKAAHQYRLEQARDIIQIAFVQLPNDGPERVYVSLVSDRVEGGYVQAKDVALDPVRGAEIIEQMISELRRVLNTYSFMRKAKPRVFEVIEGALESCARKRKAG